MRSINFCIQLFNFKSYKSNTMQFKSNMMLYKFNSWWHQYESISTCSPPNHAMSATTSFHSSYKITEPEEDTSCESLYQQNVGAQLTSMNPSLFFTLCLCVWVILNHIHFSSNGFPYISLQLIICIDQMYSTAQKV